MLWQIRKRPLYNPIRIWVGNLLGRARVNLAIKEQQNWNLERLVATQCRTALNLLVHFNG